MSTVRTPPPRRPGQSSARARVVQARRLARRVRATLQPGINPTERPGPRVRITTTRAVPAWVLRLVLLVVGLMCLVVIGDSGVMRVILGGALVVVVVLPGSFAAAVFTVLVGLSLLAADPGPQSAEGLLLLAAVHVIAVLGSLLGQVPLRTIVELRALLPTARRYVVIQAGAQLLALVAGWITERAVVVTALPILAALALAAGAIWLLPKLHQSP